MLSCLQTACPHLPCLGRYHDRHPARNLSVVHVRHTHPHLVFAHCRQQDGSQRSSEDGLSASGGGSADYGSYDRNELFKGARAVGPDGKPRARTAAEIKAAYGHGPRRCARGARTMCVRVSSYACRWCSLDANLSIDRPSLRVYTRRSTVLSECLCDTHEQH